MVWGRNKPPPIPNTPAQPEHSPDEIISEMLSAYQTHFYEKEKGAPPPGIHKAKALVERARKIIEESRIGYSLCEIAESTRPWHAWALRDDFQQYAGFPATNVSGSRENLNEQGFATRTTTQFTYRGCPYTLVLEDEGSPLSAMDDYNGYGKIRLYDSDRLVVGIDVSCDRSRGSEYERWRFVNVSAFDPGDWMKHVVEMAAHIDAKQSRDRSSFHDEDTLKRTSKTNL